MANDGAIIIRRIKKGRPRRPSRRRVESRLCRLRDGHDGLLPADVADQHHHAGAEARHRRLFRGPKHFADIERLRRRAGRQSSRSARRARSGRNVDQPERQPARAVRSGSLARYRDQKRRFDLSAGPGIVFGGRERRFGPIASTSTRDEQFTSAAESIRQAMQDSPDIADLSRQVIVDQTPEGLRIQLVDQDGRPMFQPGSTEPMPYTKKLLQTVAKIIDRLPNRISISGHTGGKASEGAMSNWELSAAAPMPHARSSRMPVSTRTASTKSRARQARIRSCRKTPTRPPIAG
jgi:flagellar motor protein MotB